MKCPSGQIPDLGATEALKIQLDTLIQFNKSTTLELEVMVKAELCTIFSLQVQETSCPAPATASVDKQTIDAKPKPSI